MNIFITLDYELFFGKSPGSVEKCIIEPSERLHKIVSKYDYKLCLFVDAGFLIALKKNFPATKKTYQAITDQLERFTLYGHDIQLHIHPHWEDSTFQNGEWLIDCRRYRLHDFRRDEIVDIVCRYKKELSKYTEKSINAFRAGGWSIQPFEKIADALRENRIYIDSTLFKGGYYSSDNQYYDFRDAPSKTLWNFQNTPCEIDENGEFIEIPISSYQVSPLFYWKLALTKLIGGKKHKTFGDGVAISNTNKRLFKLLSQKSWSVVSIDGYKSTYLQDALDKYSKLDNNGNFVVIGHPKAVSEYSLSQLDVFLRKNSGKNRSMVYSDIKKYG